jgi:hypothetical protein
MMGASNLTKEDLTGRLERAVAVPDHDRDQVGDDAWRHVARDLVGDDDVELSVFVEVDGGDCGRVEAGRVWKFTGAPKVPSPLPVSSERPICALFMVTMRSSLPSPLKSPAAMS